MTLLRDEFDAERRARDARLAWIIILCCAAVTLVVVGIVLNLLLGVAMRTIADGRRAALAREGAAATSVPTERARAYPLLAASGPPPFDTARPVGSVARWIGPGDYPADAEREHSEGRTRARVMVSPSGMPTECAIWRSSGHRSLDDATCDALMSRSRFDRVPDGSLPRRWTSPAIRWVLPGD